MQEDRFKGLYNSVAEAYDAYMKQYLPNLKDGRVPSAQALAGNDGIDVGAARRNMFYEASGPRQPEAFINQPDAEFVYDKKKKPAFRSYSLAQIIRSDVLANQGTTSFNEAGAYARMKQNFSPVDAGDKQAYRNGEGSTVIKGTKGWRAYSPEGKLVGVFDSDTDAMDKLVKTRLSPAEREKARLFAYEGEVSSYEFKAKLDKSKAEFEEQVRRNNEELARLKGLGQEVRDRTREIEQQAIQEEKIKAEEGRLQNKEFLARMKAEEKAAADAQAAAESAARKAAVEQATLDRAGNVQASTFPTGWKILKSVAGAYRLYNPAGMLQGVYRSEEEARKSMAKKVK
jgi:hypothetical protein